MSIMDEPRREGVYDDSPYGPDDVRNDPPSSSAESCMALSELPETPTGRWQISYWKYGHGICREYCSGKKIRRRAAEIKADEDSYLENISKTLRPGINGTAPVG